MILSRQDGERSAFIQDKIGILKSVYRLGYIGFDTFVLSLTLLGMSQRDAKAEAALISMERR